MKTPQIGSKGLVYIKNNEDGTLKSSVDKFYSTDDLKKIANENNSNPSDLILILAGEKTQTFSAMSSLRLLMGDKLNLRDPDIFNPSPHYLLRVEGMSMKNAGILDNDIVAVHRTSEIRSRQIVVARINDEVTVKRYTQNNSIVTLFPENSEFNPITVDLSEDEMVIEGVVVGVIRST